MIRTYFGISQNPFGIDENQALLEHQQRHFDILKVHSQQGGLCVILGEPGTGKTVLKNAIIHHDTKQWITPVINRSLHTWHNLLRLLCRAMEVDADGTDHKCEARLILEARNLNARGKTIIPIIDDAHLLPPEALRKLRLLLEVSTQHHPPTPPPQRHQKPNHLLRPHRHPCTHHARKLHPQPARPRRTST
jgi:MSHA biogenesis protein MshM